MPCSNRDDDTYVLAFLSALDTPIARRIEVWRPQADGLRLHRVDGFCEVAGSLGRGARSRVIERGQGSIGQPSLTGLPALSEHAQAEPGGVGEDATQAGLRTLMALPVLRDGRLVATVVLYF
jgi:hypothetical protein